MNLTADTLEKIDEVISRYPIKRSALMPVLHLVQEEHRYISDEAIAWVAQKLELPPISVLEVVSFFPSYRREKLGRCHVRLCRTLSCALVGAFQAGEVLERELGCKMGTTKEDGSITLEYAECLAACGTGPVMLVDEDLFENLDGDRLDTAIAEIKQRAAGNPPTPTVD